MSTLQLCAVLLAIVVELVGAVTVNGPKMTWSDVFKDRLEIKPQSKRQQRSHFSTKKSFVLSHGFEADGDQDQYSLQSIDHYGDGHYYGQDHGKENLLTTSHALKYFTVKDASVYEQEKKSLKTPLSFIYTEAEQPTKYVTEAYKFVTVPQKFDVDSYAENLHHATKDYHKLQNYDHEDESYASNYKFGYRVSDPHTGADFGHSEVSEGHVKKGHYHVLLPDGRLQNVKYWADPSGYHATVTYEGHGYHYPTYH